MTTTPHFPGRAPLDAYGNGGFRFADMSHKGSILLLPSGIYAWPVVSMEMLALKHVDLICGEADAIEFVLLGCGDRMEWPKDTVREKLRSSGVGLEIMDTGAAARTYNVLLGEGRAVAGALIAVEGPPS
jgi:uncharacterized protein